MATPEDVAQKIAQKVAALLAPLEREMVIMKWPEYLRRIVWKAVAGEAEARADEQIENSVAEPARPATTATAGATRESKGHGR